MLNQYDHNTGLYTPFPWEIGAAPGNGSQRAVSATPGNGSQRAVSATPGNASQRAVSATPGKAPQRAVSATPGKASQRTVSATPSNASQRAVSATLGLACSVSLAAPAALANAPMPSPPVPAPMSMHGWQSHEWAAPSAAPPSVQTLSTLHSGSMVKSAASALLRTNSASLPSAVSATSTGGAVNLTSSAMSYLAGNLANFSNLTIDVGGRTEIVNLNTKLTGAEVVAAEQVLTSGSQSLKLSASGVADGGTVSLNSSLLSALDNSVGGSISSLTIARGVEVVDSLSVLSISGSLSNYGTIQTAAGSSGSTDTITAGSILNASSGSIGSYTNNGGTGGGNTLYAADPTLNAVTSVTNNGTITSAGNLNITAPVVYNVAGSGSASSSASGSAASVNGASAAVVTPSISAAQSVNINTQNLTNSGVIAAVTGNVNVASTASGAGLNVAGTGGTLQANNGNINLSSANGNIDVIGGNMLSQQVNLNAGTGNVSANLDQVTGVVNATGTNVHINGNTANLNLGTIDASGDPTFTNTGNLEINGTFAVTDGADLTLIAGGNIVSDSGNTGLNTSSSTGAGGQLNLIAGATFTPSGTGTVQATSNVTVTGASASGGIIDLTGGNGGDGTAIAQIITASADPKAAAGGAIQMAAFAGTEPGSGSVIIPTSVTINASSVAGTYGNVTIIAGATSGTAVTTGAIEGRIITVDTATPKTTGMVFASSGAASGTFTASTTINPAGISLGNIDATTTSLAVSTAVLNINSTGSVTVANSSSVLTLGTISVGTTGSFLASNSDTTFGINVNGIITGNQITISAADTVTVSKTITGSESEANPSSNVTIDGASINANAVVIGAAVTASTVDIGLMGGATGNIALNAAVGTRTTALTTSAVTITAGSGAKGGSITGTGIVSGTSITLGAADSIGTAAKPIEIEAGTSTAPGTLYIAAAGSTGTVYVQAKEDLLLSTSSAQSLVLKVSGTLDVVGVVTAPTLSLTSTSTTTIAAGGSISNGGAATAGAMVITSGGAFTVNIGGSILTSGETTPQPVTINVTGIGTINGTVAVQDLALKTSDGFTLGSSGSLNDGADSITAKGVILISGQLTDTSLDMTTTKTLTIASPDGDFMVSNSGNISAVTITINDGTTTSGSIAYTATGSGNAFINSGTVNGLNVTVNTTSGSGVIDNTSTGTLEATMQNLATDVPTLNLNTHIIDNEGLIQAFGALKDTSGVLNITSSSTLKISGTSATGDIGFVTDYDSAVNIKAAGAITIGGIVATKVGSVVTDSNSNPFINLTGSGAMNEPGSFSIITTGTFSSTMSGISVVTNTAGTVGGTIVITASSVLFNGVGGEAQAPNFALTATGAGPALSVGQSPIKVDLTGSQGLTIGNKAGNISVAVSQFDATSVLAFTATGALTFNTDAVTTNGVTLATGGSASLALTGQRDLLIDGNLSDTAVGANVNLTTSNSGSFLVGGPANTTNGQIGISDGQGVAAYQLTIKTAGLVVLEAGTSTALGPVLGGTAGVNINGKGLTIDDYANVDAAGTGLTLNTFTGTTGSLSYINTNINTGVTLGTTLVNLTDTSGTLTLGSGTTQTQTVLSVGTNADGSGGVFNIDAKGLSFGSGGILFDASSSTAIGAPLAAGGQVNINLTGTSTVKVGVGAGNISANVSSSSASGNGVFSLTADGSITATNIYNPTGLPSASAIQFGTVGSGQLTLNSDGTNTKLSIKEIIGLDINTLSLTSHSTTSFVLNGATGGNGIIDGTTNTPPASLTVANLSITNSGEVITNGVVLNGMQQLALTSNTSIILSANSSFSVAPSPIAGGGSSGGTISISAPALTLSNLGLALTANGGTTSGGSISVTTTTSTIPVTIGTGAGAISFNVSNTLDNKGGSVTVVSGGALNVDASAINFDTVANPINPNLTVVGASLSLTSGPGSNLLVTNANTLTGLQLGTVTLTSGSTLPFVLSGALTNGNGIGTAAGTASLNAGTIDIVTKGGASINTTSESFTVNQLSLSTTGSVIFGGGQTISVVADGATGSGSNTGNGGSISISALSLTLSGTGVSFQAEGSGASGTTGGTITVVATGSSLSTPLTIGTDGLSFDVSDVGGKASGSIVVASSGAVTVDGSAINYGATGGGSLSVTGTNLLISNVSAISSANLTKVTLASNSLSTFTFGLGASTINGFADTSSPAVSIVTANISISNSCGGINTTGGVTLSANSITLDTPSAITIGSGLTAQPYSNGNGGVITINAGTIASGGSTYLLSAAGTSGSGGTVTVNIASTSSLTIGSSGLTVDVANAAGQAGGTVSITNGGAITADLCKINLGISGAGANLSLSADGVLYLTSVSGIANIGLDKLSFTSNSTQDFVLGGATVDNNGIADNNLAINAAVISITNLGGAIANGTLTSLTGTSSIALAANTNIGTSAAPIALAGTPVLTLTAGSSAYVSTSATTDITGASVGGALQINSSAGDLAVGGAGNSPLSFSASSVDISYNNANAGNTNTVTLANIATTGGDFVVVSNAQNLIVADGADISSTNGNISLNNTNTTTTNANANITIGQDAIIHGSGAIGDLSEGNVYIFMGAAGFTLMAGTTPANAIINETGGFAVTFGAQTTNPNGSITVEAPVAPATTQATLQALGRNLEFNTDTFDATAIIVGAGAVITADPPAVVGISQSLSPAVVNALNMPVSSAGNSAGPSTGSSSFVSAGAGGIGSLSSSGNLGSSGSSGGSSDLVSANALSVSAISAGAANTSSGLLSAVTGGNTISATSQNTNANESTNVNASTNTNVDTTKTTTTNVTGRAPQALRGGPSVLTGGISNTRHRTLEHGPLLLSPEQDQVVDTPFGSVSIAANSVALIVSSEKGLAVYNLHDAHKNAVVISSGGHTVALTPGRSAVLAKSSVHSFEEANMAPFVTYRRVSSLDVGSAGKVYQADFDMMSMMHGLPGIKDLMASDSAQQHKTMANMLKTAAILTQISQSSEAYSLYLAPAVTACLSSAQR